MEKLTKRQKYIIDKMQNGAVISVGRTWVTLSYGLVNEPVQYAFFFDKMVSRGIIYQQLNSPFAWILTNEYSNSVNQ